MASGLGNFLTFVEEHNAFSIKHSLSFLPCFNITSSQWGKSNCVFISTAQGSGPAGCSPRCNCMSKDTADRVYTAGEILCLETPKSRQTNAVVDHVFSCALGW